MRRRNRTYFFVHLALACFAPVPAWATATANDESDDLKLPSPWVRTIDGRIWSGYKDNVLLGNQNQIASPFVAGGLDLMWIRLPIDSWEALFLFSGDYTRYVSEQQVDKEANVLAEAQAKKSLGDGWKIGLSAEYVYFNQVFDNSIVSTQFVALPVEGHGLTLRPSVLKNLGRGYRLELELPATRQWFGQFIDNYWEVGPKLSFGREYGRKSDISVSYEFDDRIHDTREARDSAGNLIAGKGLQFWQHELSSSWRQQWGNSNHWRTVTRLSLQFNQDNGDGYYEFLRPLVSEQIRYRAPSWELRAEARLSYYGYAYQRIGDLTSPLRHKSYIRWNVRGEKSLTKNLKLFAQYEYETAISNIKIDEYDVNTISGGVEWEF